MPNIIEITDFHAPELDPYALSLIHISEPTRH